LKSTVDGVKLAHFYSRFAKRRTGGSMALHSIKKGLTLPIKGAPEQRVEPARP
jgi:hypothetical protein